MGHKGFSLVELVVVIGIATILLSLATLQFNAMMRKSAIEKQVRMIHTDLSELRQKALYEKTARSLKFTSTEFTTYPGASTAVSPSLRRPLSYPVVWSTAATELVVTFDTYGISSNSVPVCVCVDPGTSNTAVVDSIVIDQTRVELGKSGGTCAETNITRK